jgi:preprotein translocase subunit SecA
LLRIFAGDRVRAIMDRLKMPEGEPIEAGIVSRSIESAQRKVEARNFDIRKQLLEYDDVSNDQRKVIYQQRNELLETTDISETINSLRNAVVEETFRASIPEESIEEQWDVAGLENTLLNEWQLAIPLQQILKDKPDLNDHDLLEQVEAAATKAYEDKVAVVGRESFNRFERSVMLQSMDTHWREHLAALDHLRQGIHLRGYAQKNPKQEYKREAFELFAQMLEMIKNDVIKTVMLVRIQSREEIEAVEPDQLANVSYQHADFDANVAPEELLSPTAEPEHLGQTQPHVNHALKVGRNDPCPCGSGKKYKVCHGRLA